jgi:cytochrome b6-f complex iron-sulfur subunit
MNGQNQTTRRGFLDWIIAIGSGITAAAMTIPALMYLWPAAKGGASEAVEVDGAAAMKPGQSKTLQVGGLPVIVVRKRDGFKAYSASCTHLGCLVKWEPAQKHFTCPCHAAVFDEDGGVVSGPPPSPLPPYAIKEVGDKVYVSKTS